MVHMIFIDPSTQFVKSNVEYSKVPQNFLNFFRSCHFNVLAAGVLCSRVISIYIFSAHHENVRWKPKTCTAKIFDTKFWHIYQHLTLIQHGCMVESEGSDDKNEILETEKSWQHEKYVSYFPFYSSLIRFIKTSNEKQKLFRVENQ